jgi:NADH oxidase (H2O2-forming)
VKEVTDKIVKVEGENISYNYLFLACGLSPDFKFLDNLSLDYNRGVLVDDKFKTSDNSIFAIGDLVESINLVDQQKTLSRLATTAVSQAKSLAKYLLNKKEERIGVLSASISEFNGLIFASTGLNEKYCLENNIQIISAFYRAKDKAEYYPEARDMYVYILASLEGKILGCQIVGYSEVAGRLNMISLAIQNNLSLYQFVNSETCYNPALSPIFDPLVVAAKICIKKIEAKINSK